ncbi:unnamed protein product [Lampetra fluviatilis]
MHNIERQLNPCSAHDQVSDIPRYYLKENYTSVPIDALIQWHGKLVNECKRFADLHLMIFSLNKSHDHMSHLMDFKVPRLKERDTVNEEPDARGSGELYLLFSLFHRAHICGPVVLKSVIPRVSATVLQ